MWIINVIISIGRVIILNSFCGGHLFKFKVTLSLILYVWKIPYFKNIGRGGKHPPSAKSKNASNSWSQPPPQPMQLANKQLSFSACEGHSLKWKLKMGCVHTWINVLQHASSAVRFMHCSCQLTYNLVLCSFQWFKKNNNKKTLIIKKKPHTWILFLFT